MEDETLRANLEYIRSDISAIKASLVMLAKIQTDQIILQKDMEAHKKDIEYLKTNLKDEKDHGKKLAERVLILEKAPAEKAAKGLNSVFTQVISIVVAAVVGFIISLVVKK
jgi:predicted RNase H-like nuclease (RuvC/YqgF family)